MKQLSIVLCKWIVIQRSSFHLKACAFL